jgi:hypothetical protein
MQPNKKTTVSITGGAGLQYYTVNMAQNFANRARIPTSKAVLFCVFACL